MKKPKIATDWYDLAVTFIGAGVLFFATTKIYFVGALLTAIFRVCTAICEIIGVYCIIRYFNNRKTEKEMELTLEQAITRVQYYIEKNKGLGNADDMYFVKSLELILKNVDVNNGGKNNDIHS